MRSKIFTTCIFLLCLACLLCACGSNENTQTTPTEQSVPQGDIRWERDTKQHWSLDAEGNKININEHAFDEFSCCAVCGSEVWVFEDGSGEIYNYNAHGEWVRITSLDTEGAVIAENSFEYSYDDAGMKLWQKQYLDGTLVEEITYAVNASGENTPTKQINYDEDGGHGEQEFDENYNCLKNINYNASGVMVYQEYSEYTAQDDGETYLSKKTTIWEDGSKLIFEYNEYEDTILWDEYDANGNIVFHNTRVYEYDADGNMLRSENYTDDVCMLVCEYALNVDGISYLTKECIYNADDGSYVECTYDENENLLTEKLFDAEGNLIEE